MVLDKIKHSKFIVSCLYDGHILYIIENKNGMVINVIDPINDIMIDEWTIQVQMNVLAKTVCDNDFLYVPIAGGQILVIDKFSGLAQKLIDIGSMEITNGLILHEDSLYCACTVPIRTKNLDINNYCILKLNTNGDKLFQSQLFKGKFYGFAVDKEIYCINMPYLYCVQNMKQVKIVADHYIAPLVTTNFVCCYSKSGTLEIFNKSDLSIYNKMLIGNYDLLESQNDNLFAVKKNDVKKIDLLNLQISPDTIDKVQMNLCATL